MEQLSGKLGRQIGWKVWVENLYGKIIFTFFVKNCEDKLGGNIRVKNLVEKLWGKF